MTKKQELELTPFGLKLALAAGASAFALAGAAFAQDAEGPDGVDGDEEVEVIQEEEDVQGSDDQIVVTGSRLRKSTFNSISPLQVIGGDVSREAGLIDAASILQNSTAATGQQIDDTFAGFVTDNGPGSNTINLRSLGANRTLVLLNGRRVGPSGVEGAPRAPDIGLIPSSLVSQYELLLDGASSIYGSDAVAGVVNAILRKDFDGLEPEAFGSKPLHDNGERYTLSGAYGWNSDRGFVGIGAEYTKQMSVALADRPWTDGCDQNVEITEDGEIRTLGIGLSAFTEENFGITTRNSPCKVGRRIGNIDFIPDASTTYYIPGVSNLGIPNLNDTFVLGAAVDIDGDGVLDVDPLQFSTYLLDNQERDLIPESERYGAMAYGEYTLDGDANITPYFEAMYTGRETQQNSANPQFFPVVPAGNPFNPCGTEAAVGGFDCGLALADLYSNPNYRAAFGQANFATCDRFGFTLAQCTPELFGRPRASGPIDVRPVVAVQGDRNSTYSKVEQFRFVGGVKGDMPFLNAGSLEGWNFDVYGSYNLAKGIAERSGIRNDRLNFALGAFSDADANGTLTPCQNDTGDALDSAVTAGCVPVNMFAPSLYTTTEGRGDFATQAERDYLFDVRDFDTEYEQIIFNGFVGGNVFELQGGDLAFGFGAEYRYDEINSDPDDIARDGLFFGFFADQGAAASSKITSVFAETNIPLLGGKPLVEELTFDLSGRFTNVKLENDEAGVEEESEDFTYSAKLGYRPISSLLLRGTYGTSFRAPNLGEFGLRGQTGFNTLFDPCAVPDEAFNALNATYDPSLDDRDPQTLANCRREGVDPTTVGIQGTTTNQFFSTEIESGAGTGLEPETSRSYTMGFSFEQPFFDSFDLTIGVTHFDIEIENTIVEPGPQFILFDCYSNPTPDRSVFCDRITRDANGVLDLVNVGFINRDLETTAGMDYNILFQKDLTIADYPMDFAYDLRVTQTKERDFQFVDDEGNTVTDTFDGEFGVPEWNGIGTARLDVGDYRFSWQTRFLGAVEQDPAGVDDFDDAVDGFSDTCLGPARGDVNCRDFAEADDYYVHTASLYYRGDTWTVGGGVRNVFDTEPPFVDGSEVSAINNAPIGFGYDSQGRTFFLNVAKQF